LKFVFSKTKGMKMNKKIVLACLCGVAVMASQGAMAAVKVRGGVTNNNYDLQYDSGSTSYKHTTSSFGGQSLGLTFISDSGLYLDLASSSGKGDRKDRYSATGTFERTDTAIVLGSTSVTSGGSATNVYVGWKSGETKLGSTSNYFPQTFSGSGFIFGGGWGIPAGGGTIGLSLGMGLMGQKYTVNGTTTTTWDADQAVGVSFGLGYSYPLAQNLGLSVDYKANAYKYNFNATSGTPFSYGESFSTLSLLAYLTF
jgi:hypothetical protein